MIYKIRLKHRLIKFIWKVTKPTTMGIRAMLIKDNQILLVKHSYTDSWYLPGGSIKKYETYDTAIRRELDEELGAKLYSYTLFGNYTNHFEYKNDNIIILLSTDFNVNGNTDDEISEFQYFKFNNLPKDISPGTLRRINEYTEKTYPIVDIW